ncbi:MAG TPA: methylglyoxal synthase [Streptosporangiaceae bacterium]|nr:methylglyoxal synthase [Streptosporangiaceae bacterium]
MAAPATSGRRAAASNAVRTETRRQSGVRRTETSVRQPGRTALQPEYPVRRRIALIAHDNKKSDLAEWARFNRGLLARHDLCATGTTGHLLVAELGLAVTCLRSGPLGGDQQIGARSADGEVDMLVFFWDPLEPHPHDPDVKARCGWLWPGTSRSPATGRARTT